MSSEIFFVPEFEIKGLLAMGAVMLVALALSSYLSLRPNADKYKYFITLSYMLGFLGVEVGSVVRSQLYIEAGVQATGHFILSLIILLLIVYIVLGVACIRYIPYRKQGRDPALALKLVRDMVWALLLCAVLTVFCIGLLLYGL